ncbi:MAG: hypothetical protein AAFQ53_02380, partial [Bacteroidota bacterium]
YAAALEAHRAAWAAMRSYGDANTVLVQQAFAAGEYARVGMLAEAKQMVAEAAASPTYETPGFYRANVALSEAYIAAYAREFDTATDRIAVAEDIVDTYDLEQGRPLLNFFEAEVAVARGNYAAAAEPYAVFVASRPPNAGLLARFADVLAGAGRADEARAQYEAALVLVPAHAESKLGLAKLAIAEGAIEEAQAYLDEALAVWAAAPPEFLFAAEARALRAELSV